MAGIYFFFRGVGDLLHGGSPGTGGVFVALGLVCYGLVCYGVGIALGRAPRRRHRL
jgi:hypothetical protein